MELSALVLDAQRFSTNGEWVFKSPLCIYLVLKCRLSVVNSLSLLKDCCEETSILLLFGLRWMCPDTLFATESSFLFKPFVVSAAEKTVQNEIIGTCWPHLLQNCQKDLEHLLSISKRQLSLEVLVTGAVVKTFSFDKKSQSPQVTRGVLALGCRNYLQWFHCKKLVGRSFKLLINHCSRSFCRSLKHLITQHPSEHIVAHFRGKFLPPCNFWEAHLFSVQTYCKFGLVWFTWRLYGATLIANLMQSLHTIPDHNRQIPLREAFLWFNLPQSSSNVPDEAFIVQDSECGLWRYSSIPVPSGVKFHFEWQWLRF